MLAALDTCPGGPSLAVLIPLAGTFYDNAPGQNSSITTNDSSFTTPLGKFSGHLAAAWMKCSTAKCATDSFSLTVDHISCSS